MCPALRSATKTLFTRAKKIRHGTPNFCNRADDFKARHSQFSTCKRIGPTCNVAPVLRILGCREYLPEVVSEVVSARVNDARCQNLACRNEFFSACKWGFYGLASLRKLIIATLDGEANFLLEGCPHLVVLFDSIAGLCFYKKDHFLSLFNQCVYIHFPCPTLYVNN